MAAETGRRKKKEPLAPRERRRLRQLAVCVLLFGVVFAGRGLDLEPVNRLSHTISGIIQTDTDLQALFSQAGASFSQGEPAVETFRSLWTGLLEGSRGAVTEPPSTKEEAPEEALEAEEQTAEEGDD